ncbi:hypothetical protein E0493_09620 [Roseomonas sp. M0104]|uniref:Uncharacterized protein n=1 Tax=Teichococcus coralli TaxID=2545983 RepID=A0A845BA02_9PROT|nr:DUF6766 family protein [Pseudoroseomonas coralli]MXP63605.1 hypothetical protein [Pseudoroseomonas coralli]
MWKFLKDNSLSLAFLALFLACIIGQAIAGYALQAEDPAGQSHSGSQLAYLLDANFLKGVFSNWQAALLQLFALIVLAVFLRQKGAPHSRETEGAQAKRRPDRLRWFGRSRSWTYANSLSLAFLGMFVLSFAGFVLAEAAVYNANRARLGEPPLAMAEFLVSADLWFATLQTWQAEFFAMGSFLILGVYLRQENSPESKPVGASDEETGETNR